MLACGESVGHAGNVIGNAAGEGGLVFDNRSAAAKRHRHGCRVGHIGCKQVTHHLLRLAHVFHNLGVAVQILEQKPLEWQLPLAHGGAEPQHGAKLAPVEIVAEKIVAAIDRGQTVLYVPGIWQVIMMVVRHLPRFVFNRLNI